MSNPKKKDVSGAIINNIKILSREEYGSVFSYTENRKKKTFIYKCECLLCGNVFNRGTTMVHAENLTCDCQVFRKEPAAINLIKKEYKRGAKLRNLEYSLSNDLFERLIKDNCTYCGISPKTLSRYLPDFLYNGIDRIDSNLGYTKENVVSCCIDCNKAKWEMSQDEFKNYIERVYKFLCQKKN